MQRKHYNHSGIADAYYGDIESHATFNITGLGKVVIRGTIGEHATITRFGIGQLEINGRVREHVKFKIHGTGNVIFAERPPESVVRQIEHDPMCSIKMPGGFASQNKQQGYSGFQTNSNSGIVQIVSGNQNDIVQITRDGQQFNFFGAAGVSITGGDWHSSDNSNSNDSSSSESDSAGEEIPNHWGDTDLSDAPPEVIESVFNSIPTRLEKKEWDLNPYTKHLRDYIINLQNRPKLSSLIKELNLTSEEEPLFIDFIDPISFEYMDFPVTLNEKLYDFVSIRHLKVDPETREKFGPQEIQSARLRVEQLKELIAKIKCDREVKEKKSLCTALGSFSLLANTVQSDKTEKSEKLSYRP